MKAPVEKDSPHEHDASASVDSEDSAADEDCGSDSSISNNLTDQNNVKFDQLFMQREELQVRKARYILAIVTLLCAVTVTVAVYFSARNDETRIFEETYEDASEDILKNLATAMEKNILVMNELSAHITSTALTTKSIFPNVTLPHSDIFFGFAHELVGVLSTVYAPIITSTGRKQWEEYAMQNQWWQNSSVGKDDAGSDQVSESIYHWVNGSKVSEPVMENEIYAPIWQVSEASENVVNENLFAFAEFRSLYDSVLATNQSVLSGTSAAHLLDFAYEEDHHDHEHHPHSVLAEPVYDSFSENRTMVGVLLSLIQYDRLLLFFDSDITSDIVCVISDNCGSILSYQLISEDVIFLGSGDLHDPAYDEFLDTGPLEDHDIVHGNRCQHQIYVYPSKAFQERYITNKPGYSACVVAFSFLLMAILILIYDYTVKQRQEKVLNSALRSSNFIASLFPATVRDRLLNDNLSKMVSRNAKGDDIGFNENEIGNLQRGRPIADFFANTTVMFADISGFTAWSSTREPFQVFELLETIYGSFDQIAKRRRIFKVETIGDCYVAVSGVPTPRSDHAIAMAKFARQCLETMHELTKNLEIKLGPDTAALSFRIGLHSGPVTGGVLRGDNARFQLFGDTVNTAARMESTGIPNKIQISQTTADLLVEASKAHWITPRDELVTAKGKGSMKTFWLDVKDHNKKSSVSDTSQKLSEAEEPLDTLEKVRFGIDEKTQRLVDWNKDLLLRYLKLIVAKRDALGNTDPFEDWSCHQFSKTIFNEVAEIITLPTFSSFSGLNGANVNIEHEVEQQLYDFVVSIARMYRNNHFHNFNHASHVTMSVVKLMGRIVPVTTQSPLEEIDSAKALHDNTYGITSDPLTQFACIFAALIHDVDHEGVPNAQLVKEQSTMALAYQDKSVAEQHSFVLAWDLLMMPKFEKLRKTLCATADEVKRFRQLVVNAVMATDIMAPDLKELRQRRWNTAFAPTRPEESESDTMNRKATIVIEHLIQASDVCHTMQHWHVYRKWNECLFMEMSKAYAEGRSESNPADTWYKGEIGFFDFYIIPLAKKLAECGAFGVSSDEFLSYAIKNRDEWEVRGEDVVREMVDQLKKQPLNARMIDI